MFSFKLGKFTFRAYAYGLFHKQSLGIHLDIQMRLITLELANMHFSVHYGDRVNTVSKAMEKVLEEMKNGSKESK